MRSTITIIGAGKMGYAIAKSLLQQKIFSAKSITLTDASKEALQRVKQELGVQTSTDNNLAVAESDIILLAIKPQILTEILTSIKQDIKKDTLIISIAAGVKIRTIESITNKLPVVRVMPNTPCIVGEAACGYALGKHASKKDKQDTQKILDAIGISFELKEELLDAVTGLSGSGPAFIAYIIKAMAQAGIEEGLPFKTAYALAAQTAAGTGKLLLSENISPDELITMVSSPNGTTIAGREILEKSDVLDVMKKTVRRAAERSRELGKN